MVDFLWLDAEQAQTAWEYMLSMPLYKEVREGEREFVLVHGGLAGFFLSWHLEDYKPDEVLWCRPEPDTFIDIDCGCVFQGGRLGCLCLDKMEEIYV